MGQQCPQGVDSPIGDFMQTNNENHSVSGFGAQGRPASGVIGSASGGSGAPASDSGDPAPRPGVPAPPSGGPPAIPVAPRLLSGFRRSESVVLIVEVLLPLFFIVFQHNCYLIN